MTVGTDRLLGCTPSEGGWQVPVPVEGAELLGGLEGRRFVGDSECSGPSTAGMQGATACAT